MAGECGELTGEVATAEDEVVTGNRSNPADNEGN